MAPTRKKRTSSAAAAAAAAAQWKVGDLVLAKLKGYPAWPAMISEPQKWGLPPTKKKLLVYFYGTKEIAFCNYADLEAFTEEKKKSLLLKRHGKGADFVRAVKEIVEVFDSMKNEDNNMSGLAPANNSSSLDTGGPEEGSDLANDNKLEGNPASSMDHSMASTPGSNVAALESEHCVVNSAPDEPASSFSKKRRNNALQLGSCSHRDLTSPRRPRSSLGADHRTRDSCGSNGVNLLPVDMTTNHRQEGSSRHKCIGDDKPKSDFLPATKDVMLFNSSRGTLSQHGASLNGNYENNSSNAGNIESTPNVEVCQTVMGKEDNLDGTQDLSTSTTVTFKRKRSPGTNDVNNSISSVVPNMDEELQPNSSGNLPDSPNSANEVNKSDGDDHLPLVKRARVRMGRPQLEDSLVDELDISGNKIELAIPVVECYKHDLSSVAVKDHPADEVPSGIDPSPKIDPLLASGNEHPAEEVPSGINPSPKVDPSLALENDHSAEEVLPGMNPSPNVDPLLASGDDHLAEEVLPGIDPSPKVDLSASGEVQTACKDKEYQSKVLSLDGEAALPPSKRLHRALEAMSANAAETTSNPPEVNKSKECILMPCTTSKGSPPFNNSPDAFVKSPRSATIKGPKICSTVLSLDTPTGVKYMSQAFNSLSSISLELTNGGNHDLPKDIVHTNADDDICGNSPTCSLESKEPAFVSKLDQLPVGKVSINELLDPIGNSGRDFSKYIDGSAYPLSQAKTAVSDANQDSNSEPQNKTVLAEPTVSVGDRTSASSLVTKVTCSQYVAGAQKFEAHSLATALREPDHKINMKDIGLSPDPMHMKGLIAAAHAQKFSQPTSFIDSFLDSNVISEPSVNIPSVKEGSGGRCSPSHNIIRSASDRIHTLQTSGKILSDNIQQKSLNKPAGHDEGRSARRAFENFLGTLTRTKESIARATRLALDCAKHGIAGEVMDVIIERLEKESNLYKRVDLFFLVDSIIQCCRNQKGGVGDAYPSLIQAVLPRILYASAPPGNSAWENRRQCLKVLKLWLERKTLSEYIIRHHIKELEALNEASFGTSRRRSGTERALNDPLRDNEGMLVDEYGSNTGFHLPNMICVKLLDEEGSSSEDRSFEAVTPEHESTGAEQGEASQLDGAKHRLVFEEVNGDLEMEDVAPSSEAEASSARRPDLTVARHTITNQNVDSVPPLPDDKPPTPPPLPSSPPPLPRPNCPVIQGSQVQGALSAAPDRVKPDTLRNVQDQHSHPIANNRGNMDPCVVPFQPPPPYTSGCAGHPNQMHPPPPLPPPPPPPPVAPFHPPGPHGNFSGPPVPHHGNNYHHPPPPPPPPPPPNNAYHLQPPPPHPPGPNQFPYMPPEHQQRTQQPWNCNPPYPEGYQYNGHDRGHPPYDRRHHFDDRWHHFDDRGRRFDDGGHHFDAGGHHFDDGAYHYDDRGHHFNDRGQMHHESMDRGRFPPHFGPDPPYPDNFEASSSHHGRPSDGPPGPCADWSMPPRRSKYPPGTRHSMEPPMSHDGGWRRHGRHNNDRFHR
ncbi:protein HUA2-LIKE 3-like [Hordeum vulgare subsp. vulgare]|uniref:CID domain-containing protein n=2 Tax=Hordeum vulgare subsp. vulgare TaxID=112509 RepID=A0A8I6X397_HORVV|nr:protein HUA2-LIKE 3-like [Hordeum vulgare subsp. vulgare]